MVIDKSNYKLSNAIVSNDSLISINLDFENKEMEFKLLDSNGEYILKFINVLAYNMTPFDYMEDSLTISDFYLSLENKKYESSFRFDNIDIKNYIEFVIEFNNDDFIKIFCEKMDIDSRKVITMA